MPNFRAWFTDKFYPKFIAILGSRALFWLILLLFALQALFMAFVMRYPAAFDENFHLGIIRIYADHWLPFLTAQPPDAGMYGAVARDPSYLYHYLMSFPYRLIALFTGSEAAQVIALRVLNVGFALCGLYVYERVLRHAPLTSAGRNAVLFFVSVLPFFPLLAAQINYDNLLFPLVGLLALLSLIFAERLRAGDFNSRLLLYIGILGLLASLVKYAFLPLFAALVLFLVYEMARSARAGGGRRGFNTLVGQDLRHVSRRSLIVMGMLLVLAFGMFMQRYGVNLVRYHAVVPDCAQVISIEECSHYGPWVRDYVWGAANVDLPRMTVAAYSEAWLRQFMKENFFGVYSMFRGNSQIVDYWGSKPVSSLLAVGWTVLIVGVIAVAFTARRLWQYPALRLFALLSVIYTLALFYQNYQMYREVAVAVAIHGRYLLYVYPLILTWFLLAITLVMQGGLRHLKLPRPSEMVVKTAVFTVLVLLMTQGGGFITYIIRGDDRFYWPQSELAQQSGHSLHRFFDALVIE